MAFREDLYASYTLHPSHATTADTAVYDRVYARYLRGWLPSDPAAPVADLGCGDGKLLAFLTGAGFWVWSMLEIGSPGSGIYTRVMLARAVRGGASQAVAVPIETTTRAAT